MTTKASPQSNSSKSTPTSTQPRPPLTPADREALAGDLAKKAEAQSGPQVAPKARVTAPWHDLEPTSDKPTLPRDKSVFAQALKTIGAKPDGATLAEIKESFKEIPGSGPDGTMYHHDPKNLLKWQNQHRGWGFRMDPKTEKITLWEKGAKK
jgi:hypothetical protein